MVVKIPTELKLINNFSCKFSGFVIVVLGLMSGLLWNAGLANTEQQQSDSGADSIWAAERAQCHETIMRYLEWHSIASAIGSQTDPVELQWLIGTGFQNPGPINEFDHKYTGPEQSVETIDAVSVDCEGKPASSNYVGQLIVKSISPDGELKYHSFTMQGPDSFSLKYGLSDLIGEKTKFEPLASTYRLQLPYLDEYYRQVIHQLSDSAPTNLAFTDAEVDLWFSWPAGKLMTAVEEAHVELLKRNGTTENRSRKKFHKTALTQIENGVRLSSLYVGLPEYEPVLTDADLEKWARKTIDRCLEEFQFCWQDSLLAVPFHYSLELGGKRSGVIFDEIYTTELRKWMEDKFGSLDRYDEFVAKMLEDIQLKREEQNFIPRYIPLEGELRSFHGEKLIRGVTYTKFGIPLEFSRERYSHPNYRHDLVSKELTYLGRVSCNADDEIRMCAHLEFRMKDLDPTVLMNDDTSVQVNVDLVVEPHSLLLHKVDYDSISTTFKDTNLEEIKFKRHTAVDIEYRYEDLPE